MEGCWLVRSVRVVILILCNLFIQADCHKPDLNGPEHQLYLHLFADYTSESRPVRNASHTVQVTFDLSLNQLLDLDEKNQVLSTSVWIYEEWKDELLTWSPSEYGGQAAIMIPADNVWLPDIFIFNRAGTNMDGFVNVNGSKVSVQYDGTVRWMVPLMVSSVCAVDVTYFPYDRQACSIKFGSWIYDIDQVDVITESTLPDMENYVMNSEYDLQNVNLTRHILESSCCAGGGRHSMVELRLELRRKPLYYDYIVIAPTIMLCVLTLASFLLPCDRGEKMAIGLTVFLTLYVLQLRIADNVPDTNTTPILGVFMLIVMTFNCVSLIMATIVMNIKKRGDDCPCPNVPAWLFALCQYVIGRIVCTTYQGNETITSHPLHHKGLQPDQRGRSPKQVVGRGHSQAAKHDCRCVADFYRRRYGPTGKQVDNAAARGDSTAPLHLSPDAPRPCYDPHKTPHPHSEGEIEMRLRKSDINDSASKGSNMVTDQRQQSEAVSNNLPAETQSIDNVYMMKRRWFYVAEVVDKFLFLVYLVLLTTSIFTVLFIIPVYCRND